MFVELNSENLQGLIFEGEGHLEMNWWRKFLDRTESHLHFQGLEKVQLEILLRIKKKVALRVERLRCEMQSIQGAIRYMSSAEGKKELTQILEEMDRVAKLLMRIGHELEEYS